MTSERMKEFRSAEWIWRFVILLGVIINLWLQQNYVPRAEYYEDRSKLAIVMTAQTASLTALNVSLELLKAGSGQLGDHEARLRALERGRVGP